MDLPKYNKSSQKGEVGITILKSLIETEFLWLLRVNHKEHDFGIDAYIDVIAEDGGVTGKSIAAQVKTGDSYFKESNNIGWVFRGKMEHLNYYLNHDIPVIIILVNESTKKAYWCLCDATKTEKAGENWKIVVPYAQELTSSAKMELEKCIGPIRDYASQLEGFWGINKVLRSSDRILFIVDKPDIEQGTYAELLAGLERLLVNPELVRHVRERVDIAIHGYNDDPRELYEIAEVRAWVIKVVKGINGWAYLLAKDDTAKFLRVLQYCNMDYKVLEECTENGRKGRRVDADLTTGERILNELFCNLNVFCEKHHISEQIAKEISGNLVEYFCGSRPPGL